jgi:hypothetical protein
VRWRRCSGAGQRGVLVAWVSSTPRRVRTGGVAGRRERLRECQCRHGLIVAFRNVLVVAWEMDGGWGRAVGAGADGSCRWCRGGVYCLSGTKHSSWLLTEQTYPHRGEVRWECGPSSWRPIPGRWVCGTVRQPGAG